MRRLISINLRNIQPFGALKPHISRGVTFLNGYSFQPKNCYSNQIKAHFSKLDASVGVKPVKLNTVVILL